MNLLLPLDRAQEFGQAVSPATVRRTTRTALHLVGHGIAVLDPAPRQRLGLYVVAHARVQHAHSSATDEMSFSQSPGTRQDHHQPAESIDVYLEKQSGRFLRLSLGCPAVPAPESLQDDVGDVRRR